MRLCADYDCPFYYKDNGDLYPSCHFDAENRFPDELAPCETVNAPMPRYTVSYDGVLFDGDTEGLNVHHYERWEDAIWVYNGYPDIVMIEDTETGMTLFHGEWF